MQNNSLLPDIVADSHYLIALLEDHCDQHPCVEQELTFHRTLYKDLIEKKRSSECALMEWRAALAWRWECEVKGERLYQTVYRIICDYFGPNAPYLQIIAPHVNIAGRTPIELLTDLRRIATSLALLQPQPPFAAEWALQLDTICADLGSAIERTVYCEAQRRSTLLELRLTYTAYQRARSRTQHLITTYLGECIAAKMHGGRELIAEYAEWNDRRMCLPIEHTS